LVELVAAERDSAATAEAPIPAAVAKAKATQNSKKRIALLSAVLPALSVNEDALQVPALLAEARRDAGSWNAETAEALVQTVSAACIAPGSVPETILVLLELFALHMVGC
jgi:hypothetical protein